MLFCDSWPCFWSQNKWVFRTHRGTFLSTCQVWWSYSCIGFWDIVRKTDRHTDMKPYPVTAVGVGDHMLFWARRRCCHPRSMHTLSNDLPRSFKQRDSCPTSWKPQIRRGKLAVSRCSIWIVLRSTCAQFCWKTKIVTPTYLTSAINTSHFRPHRLFAMHRCGLLLHMSHVSGVICVSVCGFAGQIGELCKNTAEPIEIPLGLTHVDPNHTLDTGPDPKREGELLRRDMCQPFALFVCRRWRMCLPSARGGRMHSPPRGVTRRRCGLLPNYFLDTC